NNSWTYFLLNCDSTAVIKFCNLKGFPTKASAGQLFNITSSSEVAQNITTGICLVSGSVFKFVQIIIPFTLSRNTSSKITSGKYSFTNCKTWLPSEVVSTS